MTESGPIPVSEGELVAGKYRVGAVIGVGGMGIVVAALHEQLDKRIAIKFVRGEVLGNDEAVRRFLREARAAAKLRSEHAAKVLDVGVLESGVPYMVMELLEGGDLAQTLAERGPQPVEVAADWVAQACEAVAEAHAAGIVHRDLKPQNLFLARTVGGAVKVKVLDFGVSKSVETMTHGPGALTRTSAMLGSPLYMAPEQMRSSRNVDCRADVWALGVVLFELLTQRMPFEAETLPELCLKVVTDPPQSLFELRPDVPEAMVELIERCLEKDVDKRFANAAELASALEPLIPPGSRIVVERARLAMTRGSEATPPPGSGIAVREGTIGAEKAATPVRRTPAAWGSGKRGRASKAARGAVVRAAVAILAVGIVGIGGAAFVLHRRSTHASRVASASPPATVATAPPPATVADPAPSVAHIPENAPAPSVDLVSPAPPAASGRAAPAQSASLRPVVLATGQARTMPPPPPAKQQSPDDDIPALR
ncbi:MAG TPA: protein kinase [Polyangiaceae bacterium]|nr:protein kinase [Polyangiaceae bacterium]